MAGRGSVAIRAIVVAALLSLALLAAGGWHYSNQIIGPDEEPARDGQAVLAVGDSTVTLRTSPLARRPGTWALVWNGGFARMGPVIDTSGGRVVRALRTVSGTLEPGPARAAGFAMDAEPRGWLGLDYETLTFPSRIGALPAWWLGGPDSTWAIFVHGRGATRAELLRMLPAYRALGLPCLVVGYRGDADAPGGTRDGYRMGTTEWLDLEDAIRFALGKGARDVVLVGCSMGGGIVTQLLRQSPLRANVRAAVLDAPALDWNAVLAQAAKRRGVPAFLTEIGKLVTTLRTGILWDDLDQARHAGEFSTPMLILHGQADRTVPIEVSRRFAALLPGRVTLEEFRDADHVESSNFDRPRYAQVVESWLEERGVGGAEAGSERAVP